MAIWELFSTAPELPTIRATSGSSTDRDGRHEKYIATLPPPAAAAAEDVATEMAAQFYRL